MFTILLIFEIVLVIGWLYEGTTYIGLVRAGK